MPAYQRAPLELPSSEIIKLQTALFGPSPIIYITSTDSVGVLLHAVKTVNGADEWLQNGFVLTIHPRPKAMLEEVGFKHVVLVPTKDIEVQKEIQHLLFVR